MIKLFKAQRSGNGYSPYGTPFVFPNMAEAEFFAMYSAVGRYFAYLVLSDGSLSDDYVFINPFVK